MQKLLFTLSLIVAGLICGYVLQQIIRLKSAQHHEQLPRLRKFLQRLSMLGIMPISFVGALWIIPFNDLRVALLPLLGSCMLLLGGMLGLIAANLLHKSGSQKSVLFCCCCFSNLGSFGGLTSFAFFGEQGFAMLALYKIFEEFIYFGIGFPVARYFKSAETELHIRSRIFALFRDPFFLVATGSLLIGLCLNFSGITRPLFYETLNKTFIPVGIFMILVSVGLSMRFSSVRSYKIEGMTVSLIKFVLLPLVAGIAAYMLGLHRIQDGLPMKIALIGASMPVAFNALVASSIYDLDLDLANACWLITTSALVIIIPWLYFLFSLF